MVRIREILDATQCLWVVVWSNPKNRRMIHRARTWKEARTYMKGIHTSLRQTPR